MRTAGPPCPASRSVGPLWPTSRPAFSLAELMIALIILGFGLLVIGAALPVGYRYTQETVDQSTGQVAVEYALDLIEQNVRLSRDVYDESLPPAYAFLHYADIFQPRYPVITPPDPNYPPGALAHDSGDPAIPPDPNMRLWEPLIKVRPLLPVGIDMSTGPNFGNELWPPQPGPLTPTQYVEEQIHDWMNDSVGNFVRREYDDFTAGKLWLEPALPSISAVYPPVTSDNPFQAEYFLAGTANKYQPNPVTSAEINRAGDRGIIWTAFYRRVSYADGSDPQLYEIIAVASRLPAAGYRYPRFCPASISAAAARAADTKSLNPKLVLSQPRTSGVGDVMTPVPWLVWFDRNNPNALPLLVPDGDYEKDSPGRELLPTFVDSPTLRFIATAELGPLLPPGSIFIPAVNDDAPSALNSSVPVRYAGFVPHAPSALPIYEVLRTEPLGADHVAVIVKNNGFHPWLNPGPTGVPLSAKNWPIWIIPPAYKELDSANNPVYERKSSIVAVGRRTIRLREIP